ncbi:Autophagy-related protein 101 [Carex littledalei]|uniref:Autophagy-related protein 101 n=1 Tax=Carex littledalei TaxID=544730 RepID=A0A833QRH7_9POAL|nr:Autophagy-related protein 101 [Carex littledalei]
MNCESCELKELEVEQFEIREALRCILHTIFFHRALGLVRPRDVDCELFELTYVQCGVPEVEKEIEEKINEFITKVSKHPNRRNQICLSFYEMKSKQSAWSSSKTERVYWERWFVNLQIINQRVNTKSKQTRVGLDHGEFTFEEKKLHRSALEASIRENLLRIIKFANEKMDHLPHIPPNVEGISYPYEIAILSSAESSLDILKRMLQTGHQTTLS